LRAKYEVCEVIGVGSTSTVHRCVDRKTGADFACKIIDKKHMEQRFQGMVDQFHTEIQALQSLRHAHIIALYDVYITDEKIYIVMERMEGGELFDYVVQRGTLNEEEASRIVRQVTSALVYVHSMNFLHRDLKPENLLLRQKPLNPKDIEVKIIDFGLSKVSQQQQNQHQHYFVILHISTTWSSYMNDFLARMVLTNGIQFNSVHGRTCGKQLFGNSRIPCARDATEKEVYECGRCMGSWCHCVCPIVWMSSI
jgi:serine/threonine protein kinase